LSSTTFLNSSRLTRFLEYGVKVALDPRKEVNEYTIGIDVFDRDANFDTRIDPIVRVHARRLRDKLGQYYSVQGAADPIEIRLPLRSYIPEFHVRKGEPPSEPREPFVLGVGPFFESSASGDHRAFTQDLICDIVHLFLERTRYSLFVSAGDGSELNDLSYGFDAILWGTIGQSGSQLRLLTQLEIFPGRRKLWSHVFEIQNGGGNSERKRIANSITEAVRERLGSRVTPS